MARKYFGTDGIRARVGDYPLTDLGAYRIGRAIGEYFAGDGTAELYPYVLVGRDPRESSPMLETAVVRGLRDAGVKSQLLGVIPTPGLMYLTGETDAVAGVMITASHNPFTDNGVKVVSGDGKKLPDAVEEEIDRLLVALEHASENAQDNTLKSKETPVDFVSTDVADKVAQELSQQYEKFLVNTAQGARFDGLEIALDTANGATSGFAQRIFERLGATVTPLSDQPDGRNINVECGATHTVALEEAVKARQLDVGAAFDGDGDRVMLVDHKGRTLTGDHILYILALTGGYPAVVSTSMANMGLEKGLREQGIALYRTDVGDRYVLDGLAKRSLKLGGEQSGHILLLDLAKTGDGMLAAIQVLKHVQNSGRTLAEWRDEVVIWPQKLVNIKVADKSLLAAPAAQSYIAGKQAAFGNDGRLNIRASGTEQLIRVMVEAPDAENQAQTIADELTGVFASLEHTQTGIEAL